MLYVLFTILALICFAVATFGPPIRINLVALGLFFFVLAKFLPKYIS